VEGRRHRGREATPAVSARRSCLKWLWYLENSQNNSELLEIADWWCCVRRAVSTACGEIPCAAEQGTRFAI
jgi:hypothetical protein